MDGDWDAHGSLSHTYVRSPRLRWLSVPLPERDRPWTGTVSGHTVVVHVQPGGSSNLDTVFE